MKQSVVAVILILPTLSALSQGVYIGADASTSPDASAILDLDVSSMTTKKGIKMPSMTTAEKENISSPAEGLMVYQTDVSPGFYYYDGATWTSVAGWGMKGNADVDASQQYLGTTDANDLVMRTNGTERLRLDSDGNIRFKSVSAARELRFYEPNNGNNYTGIKAASMSQNVIYTLPTVQGASGEVLTNDGTGNLNWSTPVATPAATPLSNITIANGSSNHDMDIGDATFVHLDGSSSNFDITGFEGGTNGRMLILYNTGNGHMRLRNEDTDSAPENRIWTLRGGSGVLPTTSQGAITLIYDGAVQRWIAVSVND